MPTATATPTASDSPKAPPLYFLELTLVRLVAANPELIGEIGDLTFTSRQPRRAIDAMREIAASGLTPTAELLGQRLADDPKLVEQVAAQRAIGERISRPAEQIRRVLADIEYITDPEVQAFEDDIHRQMDAADPADAATSLRLLKLLCDGPPSRPRRRFTPEAR